MAFIGMAYTVMAYTVLAYVVMACIVMVHLRSSQRMWPTHVAKTPLKTAFRHVAKLVEARSFADMSKYTLNTRLNACLNAHL